MKHIHDIFRYPSWIATVLTKCFLTHGWTQFSEAVAIQLRTSYLQVGGVWHYAPWLTVSQPSRPLVLGGLFCGCFGPILGQEATQNDICVVKTIRVPSFLLSCKWVYPGFLYWHQWREPHTAVDFPLPFKCTYRKWWYLLRHLDVEIYCMTYDICPMLFDVGATQFWGSIVETCLCWRFVTSWW